MVNHNNDFVLEKIHNKKLTMTIDQLYVFV